MADKQLLTPATAKVLERPAGQMQIERSVDKIRNATKEALDQEEKVTIRLRTGPKNKPLDDALVGINGYNYQIKRGVDVEVPRSVYDLLMHAGENDEDYLPLAVLPPAARKAK